MNYAIQPEIFLPPVSFNTVRSSSIDLADGTASFPSLAFVSDNDTGVFRNGSGNFCVSSNGTQCAQLNSTVNTLKLPCNVQSDFTGSPANQIVMATDGTNTTLKLRTAGSGGSYLLFENPTGDADLRISVSPSNDVSISSKENIRVGDENFNPSVILCKNAGDGIVLLNNSIANYEPANLRAYEEKTYSNVSLTGFSVATTCNLQFTRIGNVVHLSVSGVSSSTDGTVVGVVAGSFEEPFRPSSTVILSVPETKENGVDEVGIIEVKSDGSLVFGYTPSSGWGAQPNSGWGKCSVCYHV